MKARLLFFVTVLLALTGVTRSETLYMGVQYGLPTAGFNQGGGCNSQYTTCFTIPPGKQLKECRGTFTNKVNNIEVLWDIVCSHGVVFAGEFNSKNTWLYSTVQLSQNDPAFLGNGTNQCILAWQADNNTGAPIPEGAAFEIQTICSTW